MPLLTIHTNIAIENPDRLAKTASKKVAEILGKAENYVMVHVLQQQILTFAGSSEPAAFLQLKSLGLAEDQTGSYSEALCQMISAECAIDTSRIYIEFSSPARHMWGWNNRTF